MKVVPEGYNGAGMNYDGCNRRDVNGKANAGLTLGIIGTALGAWALFGNRRSSILGGAGGGMLGDGSTNINVLGATAGSGSGAPTAFQAWEKCLTFNLTMLVIVVAVIKIFLMNFVNFLMHVEDEAAVVVEVV